MTRHLFWGDLHCHTGLSYGRGTAGAAVANGRSHVDFMAVIGHAFWHDMVVNDADPTGWIGRHFGGFEKLRRLWPDAKALLDRENQPGAFVTFLGYEWHSNAFGDYNVIYPRPDEQADLIGAETPAALKAAVRDRGAFVFPHHVGYLKGERGVDWDAYTEDLSPVVEVCSGHGEFEADDGGPNAVDAVPMGPRTTKGCIREGLRRGCRFGLIGSTDSHSSFPAAYNGGRAGVYADGLTREALWEAVACRRTIAAKGDSIAVWFEADGAPLGSEITAKGGSVHLACTVRGEDAIDSVELIRNERVHRVWHPNDPGHRLQTTGGTPGCRVFKVRLQIGWGNVPYLTRWRGGLRVEGGEVRGVRPYFLPADTQNRNEGGQQRLESWNADGFTFDCLALRFPQQFVAEIDGDAETRLALESDQTGFETRLGDLCERSIGGRERKHTATAAKLCTAVPESAYAFTCECDDDLGDLDEARYYVRVTQRNLQRAWTSPIWVRR